MPKIIKTITIKGSQGLHARPAAMFVQITAKYNAEITISKDAQRVNGKSIMGILTLGAQQGHTVGLEADGEDAEEVMNELEALLTDESL